MDGVNDVGPSEGRLVVVTRKEPSTIYLINSYSKKVIKEEEKGGTEQERARIAEENKNKKPEALIEFVTSTARDAAGNYGSIVAMTASHAVVFTAVAPKDKSFGGPGSGIAMTVLGTIPIEVENPDPLNQQLK